MQNPYQKYSQNSGPKPKPKKAKRKPKSRKKFLGRPKHKKNNKKALIVLLSCCFGVGTSLYTLAYTDEVIDLFSRMSITFSTVNAADGEKSSAKQAKKDSDFTTSTEVVASIRESDNGNLTMENANTFKALEDKRKRLEEKERELARLEEDLQKQKSEIEMQLQELNKMRRDISSVLDKKVKADQDSVTKLVGVYSNMKPQNAAQILAQVDENLAIKVLGKMKKQNAAAILNFMEPKKAQILSEKYAGLKQ